LAFTRLQVVAPDKRLRRNYSVDEAVIESMFQARTAPAPLPVVSAAM
jgi:hypothetical protein